jgi:tetratricopeptide (TPR) repeat protein
MKDKKAQNVNALNLNLIQGAIRGFIYLCVGIILFWMPVHINIELKHVFNTAKEISFGNWLMLALGAWALLAAFRGHISIPKSKAFYFYAGVILFMFVSLLWSVSPNLSIRELGPQLGCFLFFWIIVTTIRKESIIQMLISAAIASAFLATSYGLLQYYDIDDVYFPVHQKTEMVATIFGELEVTAGQSAASTIASYIPGVDTLISMWGWKNTAHFFQSIHLPQKPENRVKIYSFMGHRNYFSGYLVLIIPLVLIRLIRMLQMMIYGVGAPQICGMWFWVRSMATTIFYAVSLVFMTNCVLLTQTRGALMGLVVALCFLVLCSLILPNRDKSGLVVRNVGFGVVVTVALLAAMFVVRKLYPELQADFTIFSVANLFMAALCFSIFYFLFLLFRFKNIVQRSIIVIVFAIMLIGTYKVFLADGDTSTVRARRGTIERITQTSDWKGSAHQRSLIYSTTLRIITDDPFSLLIGKGVGTFGIHYMIYQVKLFLDTEVSGKFLWDTNKSIYAHNEYIHFWSELGLIGLSLFMAFWFFYTRRVLAGVVRVYRTEYAHNPFKMMTMLALLAGTIGTLTHCVFTFDLHLMYSMVTFYAWSAFALSLCGLRYHKVQLTGNVHWLFLVIAALLSLYFFAGFNAFYYRTTLVTAVLWFFGILFLLVAAGHLWVSMSKKKSALVSRILPVLTILGIAATVTLHLQDIYERDKNWRLAFAHFSARQWKRAFELYQISLQHDSTLGELLFDFGRAMMDSNDNPRIAKAEIDKFNIRTIRRNLDLRTMYQRPHAVSEADLKPNEELTDENLSNNFIAISAFLEATHNFTDPANFHNIALCFYKEYQRQKNHTLYEKAKDYYERAIELNPIYAQSLSNLGYLKSIEAQQLLASGKKDEAEALFKDAKSMLERAVMLNDGKTSTTYLGLAVIYQHENEMEKALKMYVNLDNSNAGNPDTKVRIAALYQQRYIDLTNEIKSNSEAASTLQTQAQEALEKAEEYFLKAADATDNNNQMKEQYLLRGLRLRIHRLSEYYKNNPTDMKVYMELAFAWVKLGSLNASGAERESYLKKGIEALKALVQQNPNHLDSRLALARAYEEMNDFGNVKKTYENILKIMSPSHGMYRLIKRKLQLLK